MGHWTQKGGPRCPRRPSRAPRIGRLRLLRLRREIERIELCQCPSTWLCDQWGRLLFRFHGHSCIEGYGQSIACRERTEDRRTVASSDIYIRSFWWSLATLSFAAHNFPTADEIVPAWQPPIDRFNANVTTQYVASNTDIFGEIEQKLKAGFSITMPDYFGNAWGYE